MDLKTIKPKELSGKKSLKIPIIVISIIVVGAILLAGYAFLANKGYIKAFQMARQYVKQTELSKEDKVVLEQLKKIMVLPEDASPTIAVITNIDQLKKDQPGFFTDAKNGDRLIIYPTQAIVFDAGANKIIKVGPVQMNQAQATAQPANFAVYNGSGDENKAKDVESKLTKAFSNAVVKVSENASKSDYEKTIIVDLVGNNTQIDAIAKAIGAEVSTLPEGEKKPDGVIALIIVGKE